MSRQTSSPITKTKPKAQATESSPFTLLQTDAPLTSIPTIASSNPSQTTILLHATNAFGTWSAGFALALRKLFPAAEAIYKTYCDDVRPNAGVWPTRERVGTCLMIPPQPGDAGSVWIACVFTSYGYGKRAVSAAAGPGSGPRAGGHAAKDGVGRVVESTRGALGELRWWVREYEEGKVDAASTAGGGDVEVSEVSAGIEGSTTRSKKAEGAMDEAMAASSTKGGTKVVIYSPKINSGNFGVDWEVTADMIRAIFGDWDGEWRILADR